MEECPFATAGIREKRPQKGRARDKGSRGRHRGHPDLRRHTISRERRLRTAKRRRECIGPTGRCATHCPEDGAWADSSTQSNVAWRGVRAGARGARHDSGGTSTIQMQAVRPDDAAAITSGARPPL
eukprot:235199-Chlamydomonas_euryale.AAC.1